MVDSFSPVTGFQHFQFGTSMPIKGRRSPSHCYKGLEINTGQLYVLFALANLVIAKKALLA
jgi:hypothetical protein